MKLQHFFLTALLCVSSAFTGARADTCIGALPPAPQLLIGYPAGGSISMSYQLCYPTTTNFGNSYWAGKMAYNNVSYDGTFQIAGTVDAIIYWSDNSISAITMNGGPLNYTVNGKAYSVTANNLTYTFNQAFQPVVALGTLTINGATVRADTAYWPFLFH